MAVTLSRSEVATMKRSAPSETSKHTIRLLLHCEDGTVPYMTPSLLKKYVPPSDDLWLGIAVRDTCVVPQFKQNKKNSNDQPKPNGYTFEFKGLDSFLLPYNRVTVPSFDLLQDAKEYEVRAKEPVGVSATNAHVQVWTPHGRHKLSPSLHSKCARGLESRAVVPLYDMALETESNKRKQTALRRNATWLSEHEQDSGPEECIDNVWVPVVLGLDTDSDEATAPAVAEQEQDQKEDKKRPMNGLAFVGQKQGTDLASQLKPHLETLDKIPPTIALLSARSTLEFLEAARAGVNLIGTSLPATWARAKRAFVVPFSSCGDLSSRKHAKVSNDMSEKETIDFDADGCIDMNDERWARDANPLSKGCACLACSNSHSRAYIHHLVKAKELLAEILLFPHNLFHLRELCRALSADTDGTYDIVKSRIKRAD